MTNIDPAQLKMPPPSEVCAFLARSLHDQFAISQALEVRALQAEAERDALKARVAELEARPVEKPAPAAAEQNAS